jgi:hypothetical protein
MGARQPAGVSGPGGLKEPAPVPVKRQSLRALAFDVVAPIALYYRLRSLGVGVWLALVAGAAAPAMSALAGLITRRRADGLGLSVMALLLLGAAVSLLTGSPRVLLARDGWLTGAWAIWFLLSLRARRPVTFVFSQPLLEGRRVFDPATRRWVAPRAVSWDALWDEVPRFRHIWRVTTVIWGAALLADAVTRLVMAWTVPISVVPGLGGALWPVTFVILQVITNVYFARSGFWLILRGQPDQQHSLAVAPRLQARARQ